jgi:hypothetical protein
MYWSTFPNTISGNPPGVGEIFDSAGGVYLAAREEPYVYGVGGKEIDAAAYFSFDSIAVPPGMRAEIRGSAGNVIFSGDGPFIAPPFMFLTEWIFFCCAPHKFFVHCPCGATKHT